MAQTAKNLPVYLEISKDVRARSNGGWARSGATPNALAALRVMPLCSGVARCRIDFPEMREMPGSTWWSGWKATCGRPAIRPRATPTR